MVKVSSRYNPAFVEYLKSVGGKWDANNKAWDVPDERLAEVEVKAKELKVEGLKVAGRDQTEAQPAEGAIRMRLSKDGRFVLISVNLIAFAEDVKALVDGKRKSVRFRVLPPPQRGNSQKG